MFYKKRIFFVFVVFLQYLLTWENAYPQECTKTQLPVYCLTDMDWGNDSGTCLGPLSLTTQTTSAKIMPDYVRPCGSPGMDNMKSACEAAYPNHKIAGVSVNPQCCAACFFGEPQPNCWYSPNCWQGGEKRKITELPRSPQPKTK